MNLCKSRLRYKRQFSLYIMILSFRKVNELRAGECGVIRSILIGDVVALLWCQIIDASAKNSSAID